MTEELLNLWKKLLVCRNIRDITIEKALDIFEKAINEIAFSTCIFLRFQNKFLIYSILHPLY